MKPSRREFLRLAGSAAALPAATRIVKAQSYPTQPLHWIVGFPPGGGATIVGATEGGRAGVGGAQVAATPAVWFVGAPGRTGGAAFFFLRRRRVIR